MPSGNEVAIEREPPNPPANRIVSWSTSQPIGKPAEVLKFRPFKVFPLFPSNKIATLQRICPNSDINQILFTWFEGRRWNRIPMKSAMFFRCRIGCFQLYFFFPRVLFCLFESFLKIGCFRGRLSVCVRS